MKPHYWLLKTEPGTYSIDDLKKDKSTGWDGIRNYQARNNLRQAKRGDLALIYHSVKEKSVVGLAKVIQEAHPDPTSKAKDAKGNPQWVQIEIRFQKKFSSPLTLETIKKTKELSKLPLIKHTRLSVMPVSEKEFKVILSKVESS